LAKLLNFGINEDEDEEEKEVSNENYSESNKGGESPQFVRKVTENRMQTLFAKT